MNFEPIQLKRRTVIQLTTMFCACMAASFAQAHHSHPYFYDFCKSVTIEGGVDSVDWKDPHTWIILRSDTGATYTVDWNPLSRLTTQGITDAAKAALVPGARIVVTGNPIRTLAEIRVHFPEFKNEVNPNVVDPRLIRRVDDSWNWALAPPQNPPDCKGQ